ncbi:MAG TPA: galactokinase [Solirubrobacteraceae bacterium]|nr:galactokinase [Solirubrobacteraceae bacterium]
MERRVTSFGPGRVNLIGEHTDYNQGLALPFAIAEGVTVRARALGDRRIAALASDLGEQDAFPLDGVQPADGWRAFVRGAAAELAGFGVALVGADLTIAGTVPRGAGLSSSAALEVALVLALLALAGAGEPDRMELARLCSRIENDWVGAQTGLLDQIASLFGERDRALRIDFRSLEVRRVELSLGDFGLVTLDSGEEHANAGSGYNERRAECAEACRILGIDSLRDASLSDVESLPAPLDARARHVITENARVDEAVAALARADMDELGRLLDASHASLRDDYEVSTAAVEDAVARCKRAGALGARVMGGGFGGSVLALMPPGRPPPSGAVVVLSGPGAAVSGS